jgi:fucose permease
MLAITLVSLLSLPLWNKIKFNNSEQSNFTPKTLSLLQMAKMPAVRTSWILFFASVALEFTCGIWCCTYLVISQGMLESLAAKFLTVYYVGMTLGRFISGLINKKLHPQKVVYVSYSIMSIGLITLFLPLPPVIKGFAIFFIGFGNGPIFPNMIYLTPINLGKETSQSIIGTQMACCNVGILLMPPVFGWLAQGLGLGIFPYYIIALYVVMVVATLIYGKLAKTILNKEIS